MTPMPSRKKEKEEREREWVSAGRGEWVASGGTCGDPPKNRAPTSHARVRSRAMDRSPFPRGDDPRSRDNDGIRISHHCALAVAEHRQEGGTLVTEPGSAFLLEMIDDVWMIRPACGPPPPSSGGRASPLDTFRSGVQDCCSPRCRDKAYFQDKGRNIAC